MTGASSSALDARTEDSGGTFGGSAFYFDRQAPPADAAEVTGSDGHHLLTPAATGPTSSFVTASNAWKTPAP